VRHRHDRHSSGKRVYNYSDECGVSRTIMILSKVQGSGQSVAPELSRPRRLIIFERGWRTREDRHDDRSDDAGKHNGSPSHAATLTQCNCPHERRRGPTCSSAGPWPTAAPSPPSRGGNRAASRHSAAHWRYFLPSSMAPREQVLRNSAGARQLSRQLREFSGSPCLRGLSAGARPLRCRRERAKSGSRECPRATRLSGGRAVILFPLGDVP
jgi:hypothetical protein